MSVPYTEVGPDRTAPSTLGRCVARVRPFVKSGMFWAVLAAGAFAVGRYAPALGSLGLGENSSGASSGIVHAWRDDVVGKSVNLPKQDVFGGWIPTVRELAVVSISCSDCGDPASFIQLLAQSDTYPVVIVASALDSRYREAFAARPDLAWVVEAELDDGVVPDAMLESAPQAVRVDEECVIVAAPNEKQSISDFLKAGGDR